MAAIPTTIQNSSSKRPTLKAIFFGIGLNDAITFAFAITFAIGFAFAFGAIFAITFAFRRKGGLQLIGVSLSDSV